MDDIDLTKPRRASRGQVEAVNRKVLPVDADTRDQHVWGAPPPGQGGRTQRTCRKCGQRMTVVGRDSPCPGKHPSAMAETTHDYDPFG